MRTPHSAGIGRRPSRRTSTTTSWARLRELRPATSYATLEEDSIDQNTGTAILDALAHLRHPTVLLTAERGLLDQVPPLYAEDRLPELLDAYPGLEHIAVADVNHYTIAMSDRGADAVAAVVREQLDATRRSLSDRLVPVPERGSAATETKR